jgi:Spy/CpxP family protein refolding chaperone
MIRRAIRLAFIGAAVWLLFGAVQGALLAQGPRLAQGSRPPLASWWERPWWNSPLSQDLNLSDAQKTDINAIVKDYGAKMMDLRTTMEKADSDVAAAFAESPVDQRKANDAIEKLAAARGDLTRTLSQMSLKLRVVLTAEQWQDLQRRSPGSRGGIGERGMGRGRRGFAGRGVPPPPPSATKQ